MALHIVVSNTADRLAEHFRDHIYFRRTEPELFEKEIVVVQSQGMGAWLNQQLSDPIAANLDTPFLNSFADEVLDLCCPGNGLPLMTEDWMFWKIFSLLLAGSPDYPELEKYVSGSDRGLKACQLAEKTAGLYDRYQIYHSGLLNQWRTNPGKCGIWQARLFRAVSRDAVGRDERFAAFLKKDFKEEDCRLLPKRVTLFGISALAPLYFDFFRKLGTLTDVWFYYLNPSMEYWSDNESKKEAARFRMKHGWDRLQEQKDADELSGGGNPLLTSLGRQGQDFFRYLTSLDDLPEWDRNFRHYVPPSGFPDMLYRYEKCTELSALQEDILLNISRNPSSAADDPWSGAPLSGTLSVPDGSIEIHSCHSELRQTEVLYDQLLRLMETESVQPRDILVMAPDISKFEPYINAVFGGGESRLQKHYAIADRNRRQLNHCADTLLKVLRLMGGKFEAPAVFDLFEDPGVSERWGLSSQDLEEIRWWIAELGVRWGINAEDHQAYCGVKFEEYSWEQALDRLILGYAAAGRGACRASEPVIPFDSAEGKNSGKIGNFVFFLQSLFRRRKTLTAEHTLAEWCDILEELPDILFTSTSQNYIELAALRNTLAELRKKSFDASGIDLPLMMYLLEKFLVPTGISEPFLRGKITFCSLMPMRSIPMDVIAVMGLDAQSFPRHEYAPGFNVVSSAGRRAALERSRNSEDRYIFLEALLAARRHLLLFYQGRDKKTNQIRPPSVPLAEVEDALRATFPQLGEKLVTEHCLQAFNPGYFRENSPLFSYSGENFKGAEAFAEYHGAFSSREVLPGEAAANRIHYPRRTVSWTAGQEPETLRQASPPVLERFFWNPCRFFLENAVGLRKYDSRDVVLEDSEKIVLDDMDRYRLRSQILDRMQDGPVSDEAQYLLLKKTNKLPPGAIGRRDFISELAKIRLIPSAWLEKYFDSCGENISLEICGVRIEGEIRVCRSSRDLYVVSRSSSIARDLISLRMRHLLLCASGHAAEGHFWNQAARSCQHLPALDPDAARKKLLPLMDYFREGHFRPLPFFPKAACSVPLTKDDWKQSPTYRKIFTGSSRVPGECEDPSIRYLFDADALDPGSPFLDEFGQIAQTVFSFAKGCDDEKELMND